MHTERQRTHETSDGIASAAIWLVFLGIPLVFTFGSGIPTGARVLAWVGIALFAVLYVCSFQRLMLVRSLPRGVNVLLWVVLLVGAAALAIPALGWNVVSMTTFVVAFIVIQVSRPLSLILSGVLVAGALIGPIASGALAIENAWGLFVGVLVSAVLVVCMLISGEWDAAKADAARELALLRERESLARDVHDVLGHSLTVIAVRTELAQRLVPSDPEAAEKELQQVLDLTRNALAEVRSTVTGMRVGGFAQQLEASVAAFESAGIDVVREGDSSIMPADPLFVWVLREATTNTVRHAHAHHVRIEWTAKRLTVTDDGVGMGSAPAGNGVTGLHERAAAVGATISIDTVPEGGTSVRAEIR